MNHSNSVGQKSNLWETFSPYSQEFNEAKTVFHQELSQSKWHWKQAAVLILSVIGGLFFIVGAFPVFRWSVEWLKEGDSLNQKRETFDLTQNTYPVYQRSKPASPNIQTTRIEVNKDNLAEKRAEIALKADQDYLQGKERIQLQKQELLRKFEEAKRGLEKAIEDAQSLLDEVQKELADLPAEATEEQKQRAQIKFDRAQLEQSTAQRNLTNRVQLAEKMLQLLDSSLIRHADLFRTFNGREPPN